MCTAPPSEKHPTRLSRAKVNAAKLFKVRFPEDSRRACGRRRRHDVITSSSISMQHVRPATARRSATQHRFADCLFSLPPTCAALAGLIVDGDHVAAYVAAYLHDNDGIARYSIGGESSLCTACLLLRSGIRGAPTDHSPKQQPRPSQPLDNDPTLAIAIGNSHGNEAPMPRPRSVTFDETSSRCPRIRQCSPHPIGPGG